jgi:hypothetical protein
MYFRSLSSSDPASVLLLMDPVLLALSLMSPLLLPKNADPEAETDALLALAGEVVVEAELEAAVAEAEVVAGAAEVEAGAAGSSRSEISIDAAASAAALS